MRHPVSDFIGNWNDEKRTGTTAGASAAFTPGLIGYRETSE